MLAAALAHHEGALLASLQAEYGINLRRHDYSPCDLAELVAWLPPGCAFWRSFGGPLAWTPEVHSLATIDLGIRVLAWQNTEDGQKSRNQPEPTKPPAYASERRVEEARVESRAAAWRRRQQENTS